MARYGTGFRVRADDEHVKPSRWLHIKIMRAVEGTDRSRRTAIDYGLISRARNDKEALSIIPGPPCEVGSVFVVWDLKFHLVSTVRAGRPSCLEISDRTRADVGAVLGQDWDSYGHVRICQGFAGGRAIDESRPLDVARRTGTDPSVQAAFHLSLRICTVERQV